MTHTLATIVNPFGAVRMPPLATLLLLNTCATHASVLLPLDAHASLSNRHPLAMLPP